MFLFKIDDELNLEFFHESLAVQYLAILEVEREYLSQWLTWPHTNKTEDNFKTFIKNSIHNYAERKSMICAIRHKGDLIGTAGFNTIDHNLRKVQIGYWIREGSQGKGIVTRVCQKLVDDAFKNIGMEKVEIRARQREC